MTKPTREWCCTTKTFIEFTKKKKVRCTKCNRLLPVLVENICPISIGEQYISEHKGKYK